MKTFFFFFTNRAGLVIATLMSAALCSCMTSTQTRPYVSGETPTPDEAVNQKKKKRFQLFKKKLGNPVTEFQRDRRRGILKLKQYGSPGPVTPYYNSLLRDDLGIEVEVIAEGVVSPELLRYAKQYNALMVAEIQKKWGQDILREAQRRAKIIHAQIEGGRRQ